MAKNKMPKEVTSEYVNSKTSLSEKDKDLIRTTLLRGVTSSKKRAKIMRLAAILAEGDYESDDYWASVWFYSQPQNDDILMTHFTKWAVGTTPVDLRPPDSEPKVKPPAQKKNSAGKRKRRGETS